tara:strand:+ start:787 stop:1404 length:618 start_codon:yes stop_codon:yes gene_type:complete
MTIDSVGVSNTSGYSFTGGDPTLTNIVGVGNGISPYTPMTGGGRKKNKKKTKLRRSISKRVRAMTRKKIKSVKRYMKKTSKHHHHKRRMKHRKAREDVIKSVESGLPIPKESSKKLTPSMQSFLNGIETATKSGSVIKFSDFKSEPGKKKSKKKKSKAETRGGNSLRGILMKGGDRNCKSCGHYHKGGCSGTSCKKKKKKTGFFN